MKIYPLGVGGAFTKQNYHNNYIIELNKKYLLIDAGTTLRYSLQEAHFSYDVIDYVFISHLHFDHVGGLEEMVLKRFWNFTNGEHTPIKTKIIAHKKLALQLKELLRNGLENGGYTLSDFCDFILLEDREIFEIGEHEFSLFDTSNYHSEDLVSAGFKLASKQSNIVFSSDLKKLEEAKILNYVDSNTVAIFQDISFINNGVHATLEEVLAYYPPYLYRKIYGMHYNDNIEDFREVVDKTSLQFVKKHQIIEV